jgi:lipid II isoglutaminyl synthase (glutamine-hydrolysing)
MTDVKDMTLRICHLYPQLLSVAGDRGNLFSIQRRCDWRGIKTEVREVEVGEVIDFSQYDLILSHGGADREMQLASRDILLKGPALHDAVEAGSAFLAVCAAYQLLGHEYKPFVGDTLPGIGLLDLKTEGGSERFMTHLAMECDFTGQKQVMVGYENHSGRTYLGSNAQPMGKVMAGWGNNGKDGFEGAIYKHVYGTYLHGPVLPKNPWFTDYLIKVGLEHRYGAPIELPALNSQAEEAAHAVAVKLAMQNKGKMSAIEATPWKR